MERISQYLSKMRRVLSRRGQKREDIEDLMQDAFVRLLEYCEEGAQVREPEAVLVRTVQRLSMNHTRDEHRDRYLPEPVEELTVIDPEPAPDEVLAADQYLEQIKSTLDSLGRKTREVFLLHRLHGFSYAQIAKQTDMSVSTVEKHIARAMTALVEERRRQLERE